MIDVVDKITRSRMMAGIRGKDTKPELELRRALHSLGLRYRLHVSGLPGRPDIVLPKHHAAIEVHGCFWHMHRCKYGKPAPATNVSFWAEKRRGNAARDKRNRTALRAAGWRVFEVWECHTRSEEKMRAKLASLIGFVKGY